MSFRGLLTERSADGAITSSVRQLDDTQLPDGAVTVDIEWAGFNYKDALCLTGRGGLVRNYPHLAGIDFAGMVRASTDPRYAAGDLVALTGWRVGETQWGGYAERARLTADFLVPLPLDLTTRHAMILGTAGLTAMLAIDRLESAGVTPNSGEILVTGAAGGVGSIAVSLLSALGYPVVALSGRPEHSAQLLALGATRVIARSEFLGEPDKPLETARYAAAIDTVGGAVLGKLLKQLKYDGAVAAIGNAAGIDLNTTVLPFILRGVSLIGIDSVMQPYARRIAAWQRLAELFDFASYAALVEEIDLEELPQAAERILAGQVNGRIIVRPA